MHLNMVDMNYQSPSRVTTKDVTSSRGIQSSRQITVYFGEYPIKIVCPKCHKEMVTKTTLKIGSVTWILVMAVFCTFWLMP